MTLDEISQDWLDARVEHVGRCMIWTGCASNGSNTPQARIGKKNVSVRRALWELAHEKEAPKDKSVSASCGTPLCVCPQHLKLRSKKMLLLGQKRTMGLKLKIAKLKRKDSKWPQAVIQAIRASDTPARLVAAEHGMHLSYVYIIRKGRARRDFCSPWAALGGFAA